MLIKIHKSYREVVAVCDEELLGKKFEEGIAQLDVKESFFKGEKFDEKKASQIIKNLKLDDATFNIIGEKSINLAIETGIINEEGVLKIQGIPYALVLV